MLEVAGALDEALAAQINSDSSEDEGDAGGSPISVSKYVCYITKELITQLLSFRRWDQRKETWCTTHSTRCDILTKK